MSGSFVTLESADGYSFVVPRTVALASPTLKAMLDEDGAFAPGAADASRVPGGREPHCQAAVPVGTQPAL